MASLEYRVHEHALIQQELSENCSVECFMCGQEIHGMAYCCQEHCNYFIDESCASVEFPDRIQHPCHPEHGLIFAIAKPWSYYSCGECSFDMPAVHAIATLSTPKDERREDEVEVIEHISHHHPLTSFHLSIPNWLNCRGRWLRISGRAYGCHRCGFLLHASCAQAPRLMSQHPFHPQHSLSLIFDCGKGFHCQACDSEWHNYLAYYCHRCHFHLDMACASTVTSPNYRRLHEKENEEDGSTVIQHFSHRHPLTSFHFKSAGTDIRRKVC